MKHITQKLKNIHNKLKFYVKYYMWKLSLMNDDSRKEFLYYLRSQSLIARTIKRLDSEAVSWHMYDEDNGGIRLAGNVEWNDWRRRIDDTIAKSAYIESLKTQETKKR